MSGNGDTAAASAPRVSDGGVAARHPSSEEAPLLVAPSVSDGKRNTRRSAITPIACWRVDDLRFAFDSSFVDPTIRTELRCLSLLIDEHPGSPLSVFGHADPVGDD